MAGRLAERECGDKVEADQGTEAELHCSLG